MSARSYAGPLAPSVTEVTGQDEARVETARETGRFGSSRPLRKRAARTPTGSSGSRSAEAWMPRTS